MSWRGVKALRSATKINRNLYAKQQTLQDRQDAKVLKSNKPGGGASGGSFWLYQIWLLKNTKKSNFCYKSFLKSSKCLSGNVTMFERKLLEN
jgi:hypothetical protein